jgi:hypothetical protein
MTRTIGAAIGLVLVVLFFASLGLEHRPAGMSDVPNVAPLARR